MVAKRSGFSDRQAEVKNHFRDRNGAAEDHAATRIKEAGKVLASVGETPAGDFSDVSRADLIQLQQSAEEALKSL